MRERLPKRYRFDNHRPVPHDPRPLPVERRPVDVPAAGEQLPPVVHIHQAPPDRTVQRLALGAGMGGGAVAACVYFGPLLVGALTAMIGFVIAMVLMIAVSGYVVVSVVRSVAASGKGARK